MRTKEAKSDDIRRTLVLFYFDEISTREIAEALKVPAYPGSPCTLSAPGKDLVHGEVITVYQ